jgi:hypothetical protein
MAVGAAFNPVFLVYVTAFGAPVGFRAVRRRLIAPGSRALSLYCRGEHQPALMIVSGVGTAVIWAGPAPARLDRSTTLVTVAIDCVVRAPAAIASGFLIWRRLSRGYLMAVQLLILLALLAWPRSRFCGPSCAGFRIYGMLTFEYPVGPLAVDGRADNDTDRPLGRCHRGPGRETL